MIGRRLTRFKRSIKSFRTNTGLKLKARNLLRRNRNYPRNGDSLPILKVRKQIIKSTMPKKTKDRYNGRLATIFETHLRAGKSWIDFVEMISQREKELKRKFDKTEKEHMWKQWSRDQNGY